jgi:hypothetical protein
MSHTTVEGGCLCGHIRYRASGPPFAVSHCHCEQCRRYTGAVFATGVAFSAENITWLHDEPSIYMGSDLCGYSFCPKSGSSIAYHWIADDDILLTIGTLDHPELVTPQNHIFIEEKIDWVKANDGLPQYQNFIE